MESPRNKMVGKNDEIQKGERPLSKSEQRRVAVQREGKQYWNFPNEQVTIEADSYEEALEKLQDLKDKK